MAMCGSTVRSALGQASAIALLGVLIGAAESARRPVVLRVDAEKLEKTVLPAPVSRGADAPAPAGGVPGVVPGAVELGLEITVEQAFALFQAGTPFLDARHEAEFNEGHATNAIRMTSDEFLPRAGEVMGFAPGPVVIYCTGGTCDASHNLAKLLQQAGFTKIHIMKDGYPAWARAHPELVVTR